MKPEGKRTIAKESDKRPAVGSTAAGADGVMVAARLHYGLDALAAP